MPRSRPHRDTKQAVARGSGRDPQSHRSRPVLERLECRRLLSAPAPADPSAANTADDAAPPRVVDLRVLGDPRSLDGLAVTFSRPLDPARARDVGNYALAAATHAGRECPNPRSDNCEVFFNLRDEVGLASADYDDAARTVTLAPRRRRLRARNFQILRVRGGAEDGGSGTKGLTDVAGTRLDGDGDGIPGGEAVFRFRRRDGRQITYRDADGDHVRFRLRGPGKLTLLQFLIPRRELSGDGFHLWVTGRTSAGTVLSGTIKPGNPLAGGNTTLREIVNPGGARIEVLADPAFRVGPVGG